MRDLGSYFPQVLGRIQPNPHSWALLPHGPSSRLSMSMESYYTLLIGLQIMEWIFQESLYILPNTVGDYLPCIFKSA